MTGELARFEKSGLTEGYFMEIIGSGIDIIECERIQEMIDRHGDQFLNRVYTPREISYCQQRKRAVEHFAGRWAVKEAVLKAIGTGWTKGISWRDIEVRNDRAGKPRIAVRGMAKDLIQQAGIEQMEISLSHCRAYAVAHALAVRATGTVVDWDEFDDE